MEGSIGGERSCSRGSAVGAEFFGRAGRYGTMYFSMVGAGKGGMSSWDVSRRSDAGRRRRSAFPANVEHANEDGDEKEDAYHGYVSTLPSEKHVLG